MNLCRHFNTIWKTSHPSLPTRTVVGATTPCTWNVGPNWPTSCKNSDSQSIFSRSVSAVTSSEKSSIVVSELVWKFTTRSNARTPPSKRGNLRNAKWPFSARSALHFKKVCYKLSFLWILSATELQSIHWLIYRCKNGSWGRPLIPENLAEIDPPFKNADFQSIFARSTSAVTPRKKFN